MDVNNLITTVGFPATLLLLILFFGWRVARWFAPLARRVVDQHIDFLDATKQHQATQSDTLKEQTQLLKTIGNTNEALSHWADAASAAFDDEITTAQEHLNAMRESLKSRPNG